MKNVKKLVTVEEDGQMKASLGGDDLLVFFQDEGGMTRAWAVGSQTRAWEVVQLAIDHLDEYRLKEGNDPAMTFTGHVWNKTDHWDLLDWVQEAADHGDGPTDLAWWMDEVKLATVLKEEGE